MLPAKKSRKEQYLGFQLSTRLRTVFKLTALDLDFAEEKNGIQSNDISIYSATFTVPINTGFCTSFQRVTKNFAVKPE